MDYRLPWVEQWPPIIICNQGQLWRNLTACYVVRALQLSNSPHRRVARGLNDHYVDEVDESVMYSSIYIIMQDIVCKFWIAFIFREEKSFLKQHTSCNEVRCLKRFRSVWATYFCNLRLYFHQSLSFVFASNQTPTNDHFTVDSSHKGQQCEALIFSSASLHKLLHTRSLPELPVILDCLTWHYCNAWYIMVQILGRVNACGTWRTLKFVYMWRVTRNLVPFRQALTRYLEGVGKYGTGGQF